jgi:hypothetical protein
MMEVSQGYDDWSCLERHRWHLEDHDLPQDKRYTILVTALDIKGHGRH